MRTRFRQADYTDEYAMWTLAYAWLCRQRKHAPANADVWDLRWRWTEQGSVLFQRVFAGKYRLSPMQVYGQRGEYLAMWSAADALVLKWVTLRVEGLLPKPDACHHLKGKGVLYSLESVTDALNSRRYGYVHRTDIRGYYEHIRTSQLIAHVSRYVTDPVCLDLISQYAHYSVEYGGNIHTPPNGIPRGCALSPLIGGSLLHHIDSDFASLRSEDYFYVRYMDDFLLFTRTRWQLRRGISRLANYFNLSGFVRHPDKTQTGKIDRGFDWTGIWFTSDRATIAPRALNNHRERRVRLYEQARRRGLSCEEASERVRAYDERWGTWADRLLKVCRKSWAR
ncbi:RNA-directed DNA polymerase [Pantoea agglomerans]|uniref:RNA-directed DNA polymerase n=1 Tax=Enterobacter agglomerans TaxID=549 RepID=UPI00223B775A|nr:RNA-directed DNA polymerase [Pantoea agglomerans]